MHIVKSLIADIHDIIPPGIIIPEGRPKRGLLNIIEKVAKGLFGLAVEDDVKAVRDGISGIITIVKQENHAVHNAIDELKMAEKIMRKRVDNVIEMIKSISNATLNAMHEEMIGTNSRIKWLARITEQGITQMHDADMAVATLGEFHTGVQMLSLGLLPVQIISRAAMEKVFETLSHTIHDNDELEMMHLMAESAQDLYRNPNFRL